MRVLLTGDTGLAKTLRTTLDPDYVVTTVSRKNGFDLANVSSWAHLYFDYDIVINNAYHRWSQVEVLETFVNEWHNDSSKIIINVGSTISDYTRSETHLEHQYLQYRLHKQALQLAFQKISKTACCDVKLINPGPFESDMSKHLDVAKLSKETVASYIKWMLGQPTIKRLDLWQ
jgi:hypothetical protein